LPAVEDLVEKVYLLTVPGRVSVKLGWNSSFDGVLVRCSRITLAVSTSILGGYGRLGVPDQKLLRCPLPRDEWASREEHNRIILPAPYTAEISEGESVWRR